MTDQQPATVIATVTGPDLLRRLDDLTAIVSRLAAKFDAIPDKIDDHEGRIRGLERRLWIASGAAATVGTGIGWVLQQMGHA